jgi:hypothetical protein
MFSTLRSKVLGASAFVAASLIVFPAGALATESAATQGVKKVAEGVSSEGVEIVLAILGALVAILVAVIIIPKAIGLIKRFI